MAGLGNVAMASILVAFVCIASMLTVSEGTLQASVSPVERRNLRHSAWQNPQVYTQKCPGDRDWYSQKPRNFWNLYRSYCDPKHLPINQWGNFSEMILDQEGISGFGSYSQFYTGRVSMKIKLPCTNSSGTVFAFYMSSNGSRPDHDEIDIELLGNQTNCPITMQTNIFVNGMGNREMRHDLWFNPCDGFHEYFIQWNSAMVLIGVDSIPVRVFMNNEKYGLPFLNKGQGVYCSHWDGSSWATRGGAIHIDYALNAPFIAEVEDFGTSIQACRVPSERDIWPCKYPGAKPFCWERPQYLNLTSNQKHLLRWVDDNYCIYDYCKDNARWPRENMTKPPECNLIPY